MNQIRPLPGPEIYDGIESLNLPDDVQGWHSQHPIFEKLIEELSPRIIVECGTWKGASAINMAQLLAKKGWPVGTDSHGGKVFCIDTWLGGIDHEINQQVETSVLERERGFPRLYFQFLHNVAKAGLQKQIVPIPQTSINGARFLHAHKIVADLIYIDGSHEFPDALMDMDFYWRILRKGGVMFGDDYGFPGVSKSVAEFATHTRETVEVVAGNFWMFRKP